MTIIDPTYLPPVTPINKADVGFATIGTVQPFSPRTGVGYQDLLESLRVYVQNDLYNFLTATDPQATWDGNVDKLIAAVQASLDTQSGHVEDVLQEAVAEIVSGTNTDLYDAQIKAGLQATNSTALAYLIATLAANFAPVSTQQKVDRRPYVIPEDYVQAGDNGDWTLAIKRALTAATPLGASVLLGKMYACATTIILSSNDSLIGLGRRTGVQSPVNAPITLLSGSGINGVHLENFTVDGNALTAQVKSSARSVRFVNCNKLRYLRMHTRYNPDWATSFEQCTDVHVRDYSHEAGNTSGAAGAALAGRDGIHFLDCNDVLLDGARGHSRDDFVGITSQTQTINRITVRNVTGVSETAAVVTLGNESTSAFAANELSFENISSTLSPDYASATNYIVKLRAQNSSVASRIRVSNVSGTARSHAVYLDHLTQLAIGNVDAVSSAGHGVYFNNVSHFSASNVKGTSQSGAFDGLNLTSCTYGMVHGGAAENCSLWGMQINGGSDIQVWGFLSRDNGGPNFASNTGGNLRVINTTANVKIYGGEYVGQITTSYYGLNSSGNTGLDIATIPPITAGAH